MDIADKTKVNTYGLPINIKMNLSLVKILMYFKIQKLLNYAIRFMNSPTTF